MTSPQDTLVFIDDAIAHLDQAREALRQIPREGEQAITVDGIAHELNALAPRLQALRDSVASETDRAG